MSFKISFKTESCTIKLKNQRAHNFASKNEKGLDSIDANNMQDDKLFILSLVASSLLVLNIKELLKGSSLDLLARLTNIARSIELPLNGALCNSLFWVFRDVTLKNAQKTDGEFLKEQIDSASKSNKFNMAIINQLFKEQKAFCLPFPVNDDSNNPNETVEYKLENLQTLSFEKLRREFDYKINVTVKNAREKVRIHPIREGKMFYAFIKEIVEQLNRGSIVNIDNARTSALNYRFEELSNYIKTKFQEKVRAEEPLKDSLFEDCSNKIFYLAGLKLENEILNNMSDDQKDEAKNNFRKNFEGIKIDFKKINQENTNEFDRNILETFWDQRIKTKLSADQFKCVEDFEKEVEIMKETYDKEAKGEEQIIKEIYSAFIGRSGKDVEFIVRYFSNWKDLSAKYDLVEKYNRLEKIYIDLKLQVMG